MLRIMLAEALTGMQRSPYLLAAKSLTALWMLMPFDAGSVIRVSRFPVWK